MVHVHVPRLPQVFEGLRVALIADTHHGIFFSTGMIDAAVALAHAFRPDLIVLLGDYVYGDRRYIVPAIEHFAALTAPLGVFAVLGNHDNRHGRQLTIDEFARHRISLLINRGMWVERAAGRIFLAGIDDLWTGRPDVEEAVAEASPTDCTLLLSHNPDVLEYVRADQAAFVLAGHTHGGQCCLPFIGSPWLPSKYGEKYRYGVVRGPHVTGYVTSGVGCIFPPVRFNCEAEVACLTLHEDAAGWWHA